MNEIDIVTPVRGEVYRIVSLVMLNIVLMVLVVVGLGLPLFYAPKQIAVYMDMGVALPTITRAILTYCSPMIMVLASGLLGTALVVKEILTPPKVRVWINVFAFILLVFWGIIYIYALWSPMWSALQAMQ